MRDWQDKGFRAIWKANESNANYLISGFHRSAHGDLLILARRRQSERRRSFGICEQTASDKHDSIAEVSFEGKKRISDVASIPRGHCLISDTRETEIPDRPVMPSSAR